MTRDILARIQEGMPGFSKGQKRIGEFILRSYDKAAFMTANRLGRQVGVSESTVVRFAAELGFEGYPSMQQELQKIIRSRLTSVQRIEVARDRISDQEVLGAVLQADMEKIRQTLEEMDRDSFDRATDAIAAARRIYIVGVRASQALAVFLHFYLSFIFDDVVLVSANSASEVFERLFWVGPEDVVLGISFPRYSTRTVQAMSFARDRGATAVAITDSDASPLAAISQYTLKARSDMASFVDSLVAPLSLVNALLVEVSRKKGDHLAKTFQSLEKIWEDYGVYQKAAETE